MASSKSIGYVNIGIVFLFVGILNDAYTALSNSDWLFHTQSRELLADWYILAYKATLNINMPYTRFWGQLF